MQILPPARGAGEALGNAEAPQAPVANVTHIRPARGWPSLNLLEVWDYRDLLRLLAWKDITVRYKQSLLGPLWVILQPFLTMVVFSVFFGRFAKVPSEGLPYPVFSFAALVPWGLFASSLTQASNSLVSRANLVKKVYFPRLVIPVSCIGSALIDFCITSCVLAGIMAWYGIAPTRNILWLPVMVALATVTSLGASLWLSAINVRYRDVRLAVPFLVQLWFFATPVTYPSSLLPEPWRTYYGLNPMVGVIDGFRWALLGSPAPPGALFAVSTAVALALLCSGAVYFRRMEATFADVV